MAAASVTGKRERGGGEGPSAKRQRLHGPTGNPLKAFRSTDRLSETQMQDLLRRLVRLTEGWPCQQLESLHASLDWILDSHEADTYGPLNDCISQFEAHGYCPDYLKRDAKLDFA